MASGQQPLLRNLQCKACLAALLSIATASIPLFGAESPAELLLQTGTYATVVSKPARTLRVVTYNVHGPLPEDVESICTVLAKDPQLSTADVWALQEVRTSADRHFTKEIAQRLEMHYAHAVARPRGDGWEGLAFLSRLPMTEAERIELPHLDTGDRLRIGLFVTLSVGDRAIRLCNVHLPIKMDRKKRSEQLRLLIDHFDRHPTSSRIILGDFNTITGGLRRLYHTILKNGGFQTPFEGNAKTYQKYFFLRFKLDWIYLRGARILGHGIEQKVKASDHRPVWVDIQ